MKHYKSVKIGSLKEKWLRITITLGPFASKLFKHYSCCRGSLRKQCSLLIHYSCCWDPLKARYFAHYSCKRGPRQVPAYLPSNPPLYITLTMILYENMKPTEHALLHPICVLSHLMYACKHCNVTLSLYYWTHCSCGWIYHLKKHRFHAICHNLT